MAQNICIPCTCGSTRCAESEKDAHDFAAEMRTIISCNIHVVQVNNQSYNVHIHKQGSSHFSVRLMILSTYSQHICPSSIVIDRIHINLFGGQIGIRIDFPPLCF